MRALLIGASGEGDQLGVAGVKPAAGVGIEVDIAVGPPVERVGDATARREVASPSEFGTEADPEGLAAAVTMSSVVGLDREELAAARVWGVDFLTGRFMFGECSPAVLLRPDWPFPVVASAWATPDPLANAAPSPNMTVPTPSQPYGARGSGRTRRRPVVRN